MSHVSLIDCNVIDLDCLKISAEELGGTLVEKSTYEWFGRHVGDYPIPEGFTKEEMGMCDYAIKFSEAKYEVGVVKKKEGKGYHLLWDFWNNGFGLKEKIGENGIKLIDEYRTQVIAKKMKRKGYHVKRTRRHDGIPRLILTK